MSDTYLIQFTIGPVQDFIASARKLRDLWFGSYMLSELSKTIARCMHEEGGNLIFPCVNSANDLEKNSDLIVANKILLKITTDKDPNDLISQAKAAWKSHLNDFSDDALKNIKKIKDLDKHFNESLFRQQTDDFGEFFGVWLKTSGTNQTYEKDKENIEKLMASRKNLREFSAPNWEGEGLTKSSLDGVREAVLGGPKCEKIGLIKRNERLDALGCIKRFPKQNKKHFDDLSRIAISSFIEASKNSSQKNDVIHFVEKFEKSDSFKINSNWNFNTEIFFYDDNQLKEHHAYEEYKRIKKNLIEPHKYACVLLGDGDRMGLALDAIKDAEGHRDFSRLLGEFAQNISLTIEQHNGSLIYAGGDDVMAYVPVYQAVKCADAVRKSFEETMTKIVEKLKLTIEIPTFSIGLAIVHHSEPLDNALNLARKAEQIAKQQGGRNALAVLQHKRGGSDLIVYGKWQVENQVGIAERLQLMTTLHRSKKLPSTLGYQLRQVRLEAGDELDFKLENNELVSNNACAVLVKRILRQKEESETLIPELKQIIAAHTSVKALSDELVISRQFSEDTAIAEFTEGEQA